MTQETQDLMAALTGSVQAPPEPEPPKQIPDQVLAMLENPPAGMDREKTLAMISQMGYDVSTLGTPKAAPPPAPEPKPTPIADAAPPAETKDPAVNLPPKKKKAGRPTSLNKADRMKLACAALQGGNLSLADAIRYMED